MELTDGEGRFKFPPLKRAEYGLATHRDGFTDRTYKVELSDFDQPKELPVELFPQGVITGKVVDGYGQPLQDVRIEALPVLPGKTNPQVDTGESTNDLGEYRVSGLNPGIYKVRATYRDGRESEFDSTPITTASSFFGDAAKPTEFTVKAGTVIAGIDFVLNPVRPVSVHGTVRTEQGQPVDRATLWIASSDGGGHNGSAEDGKFEISDVSPGRYTISAETLDKTMPLFGAGSVEVRGEDVSGINLVMHPTPKIEGQIQVAGGGDDANLSKVQIMFLTRDRTQLMPMVLEHPDNAGAFGVALRPGEYTLTVQLLPGNLQVAKVMLDDTLVTNWKIRVDSSSAPKKLVIVLSRKDPP